MTRAEQFILENQAVILLILTKLAGWDSNPSTARDAYDRAHIIFDQIKAWRDETPPQPEA